MATLNGMMPKSDAQIKAKRDNDLTRRLERYRQRVESEGRKRSLRIIDRAIGDAAPADDADQGILRKGKS
jgi:hypothetical protein